MARLEAFSTRCLALRESLQAGCLRSQDACGTSCRRCIEYQELPH